MAVPINRGRGGIQPGATTQTAPLGQNTDQTGAPFGTAVQRANTPTRTGPPKFLPSSIKPVSKDTDPNSVVYKTKEAVLQDFLRVSQSNVKVIREVYTSNLKTAENMLRAKKIDFKTFSDTRDALAKGLNEELNSNYQGFKEALQALNAAPKTTMNRFPIGNQQYVRIKSAAGSGSFGIYGTGYFLG